MTFIQQIKIQIAALAADEDAFGSTLALGRARTDDEWRLYANDGPHSVTYAAVVDGRFAGLAFWLDVTRDWHGGGERLWPA